VNYQSDPHITVVRPSSDELKQQNQTAVDDGRVAVRKASTAADVIVALGGADKVAAICDVKKKLVYQWTWLERFPARYYPTMAAALKKRNFLADPSLWRVPLGKKAA
jgi:hypothetical protein